MCYVCIEFNKQRMTIYEARKALTELVETSDDQELARHYRDLARASDDEFKQITEENG